MLRAISILATISLAACQSTGGSAPPLVTYSLEQQAAAAKELRALPKGSQIGRMIVDYGKTRKAIRAVR